jgi:hypothetical protein
MGSAGVARLVWPGMILVGLLLAAFVWAAWPEPTVGIVRVPDAQPVPKTAPVAAPGAGRPVRAARKQQPAPVTAPPPAAPVVEEEPVRVLAAVEPERAAGYGPAPVPSELELAGDYAQESPEELGAKPLPGVVVTPAPPPVAG